MSTRRLRIAECATKPATVLTLQMGILTGKHERGLDDTAPASLCNVKASAELRAGLRTLRATQIGETTACAAQDEAQIAAHRPGLGGLDAKLEAFRQLIAAKMRSASAQLVDAALRRSQAPNLSEAAVKAVHLAHRHLGTSPLDLVGCLRASFHRSGELTRSAPTKLLASSLQASSLSRLMRSLSASAARWRARPWRSIM